MARRCAVGAAKNVVIDAGDSLTLRVGNASLTLKKDGTIVLKGNDITIEGSGAVNFGVSYVSSFESPSLYVGKHTSAPSIAMSLARSTLAGA